jgi:hypothetical protein
MRAVLRLAVLSAGLPAVIATFEIAGDPRSSRTEGTQIEVPSLAFLNDNRTLAVNGYHAYRLEAGNVDNPVILKHEPKFRFLKSLFSRLNREYGTRTMIDIGCSGGLISLSGAAAGLAHIDSLDHDKEYIEMFQKIVSWAGKETSVVPQRFSFGDKLPGPADLVVCGALIHWVYCRTADFQKSFERIFEYLFAAVNPGKFLVIEWVLQAKEATARKQTQWWPDQCFTYPENRTGFLFTNEAFQTAALRHADLIETRHTPGRRDERIFYVFRKRTGRSSILPVTTSQCDRQGGERVTRALGLARLNIDGELRPNLWPKKSFRVFYSDADRTMMLKHYAPKPFLLDKLHREVCALRLLQRFEWAPRLLCVGRDFMLTSHMGRPVCADEMNSDYVKQLDVILRDMDTVGVHHNDLLRRSYKGKESGSIEVVVKEGKLSMIDFDQASIGGSATIDCIFDGVRHTVTNSPISPKDKGGYEYFQRASGMAQGGNALAVVREMRNCTPELLASR